MASGDISSQNTIPFDSFLTANNNKTLDSKYFIELTVRTHVIMRKIIMICHK